MWRSNSEPGGLNIPAVGHAEETRSLVEMPRYVVASPARIDRRIAGHVRSPILEETESALERDRTAGAPPLGVNYHRGHHNFLPPGSSFVQGCLQDLFVTAQIC